MRVVLDIKDNKVDFLIEILKKYSWVRVKAVKRPKEELIKDIESGIEELKLIRSGKKEARDAREFLKEV